MMIVGTAGYPVLLKKSPGREDRSGDRSLQM